MIGTGLGHIAFTRTEAGGALMAGGRFERSEVTVLGALVIEWYGPGWRPFRDDFSNFLYSGIGLAVVFTSMNRMGGFNLSSILFGSLMISKQRFMDSGRPGDFCLYFCGTFTGQSYLTFDETSARVAAGLPADRLNMWLAVLTALTVALSMRIVGLLLVSAMMVIPVACALQTARSLPGRFIALLAARYRFRRTDLYLIMLI